MADVFFDNPPILMGDERTQLQQLSSYLHTVSNKLNEALMNIGMEQFSESVQTQIRKAADGNEQKQQDEKNALKSLIIKTAEIVRTEMTEITTRLESETVAISEQFGIYEQSLESNIRATAEGILQDYQYEERITGMEDSDRNTQSFIDKVNQYIFTGLISENPVKYGIAIGEGVTAYDANGNAYLKDDAKCATFTMDRLSFWQGSVEVAYFSSGKFYIAQGEITNTLQIGNFVWKKMANGAIALVNT